MQKNLPLYTSLIETEVHLLYFNFLNTITYFAASSPDHCRPRSLHSSVQGGGLLVAAWSHLLALGGRHRRRLPRAPHPRTHLPLRLALLVPPAGTTTTAQIRFHS